MAGHATNPLSHVLDHPTIELPWPTPLLNREDWSLELPITLRSIFGIQITRFMVMEIVAAGLMLAILVPVVRHIARTPVSRGWFPNIFEAMLLFIRDDVARPSIGGHAADRFLPYLWTVFFFVLFNNLLGMFPGGASATGNVNVTGVLALMTLVVVISAGSREMGFAGFWISIVPHMDVPKLMKPFFWGMMFVIEVAGLLIRHVVLAIRLFANMFAGHIVLSVILGFILMAQFSLAFWVVMPASIVGVILLSLLELFVAFLQAYIFTFLSAIFIGSAVHPH
ncbi:MAG: F0F1 ATP synthase subunit A [Isosphaeraceae bacterium]